MGDLGALVALVCGSRSWTNPEPIRRRLRTLPVNTVVLHGGARGADRLAGQIGRELGLHVAVMPALWDRYGRDAGRLRNVAMLTMQPTVVIAFWDGRSPGTGMMIRLAGDAGVPVEVIRDAA